MDEIGVEIKKLRIEYVCIHPGKKFVTYWKNHMQEVKTSEGVFIDNMIGKQFGDPKRGKPGFDWVSVIGKEVTVRIIDCDGFKWINQF